jgi:purine nucleosidase
MPRRLIIDTDVGTDDAQALVLALCHPDFGKEYTVQFLTTVAGNVGVHQATKNTLACIDACGRGHLPVYQGAACPLNEPAEDAKFWHGGDGLGDAGLADGIIVEDRVSSKPAALALVEYASAHPSTEDSPLDIITLGPLTNVALACRLDAGFAGGVRQVFMMAGAYAAVGNSTMAAEFNAKADPEALHIVMEQMSRTVVCGWELTLEHMLPWPVVDQWIGADTPQARFIRDSSAGPRAKSDETGYWVPDPLAMGVGLGVVGEVDSEVTHGTVELTGTHTRGMTVFDRRGPGMSDASKAQNCMIVKSVDQAAFEAALLASTKAQT